MKKTVNQGWHVLYVKSHHEKKVYERLIENQIEAYLPLIKTERKWSNRTAKIVTPLFKSYVFVNIKTSKDFHSALAVNGACVYISFGKEYAIVKDEEIQNLKFLVSTEGINNIKIENKTFDSGQLKTINKGPLNGFKCEIIHLKNKNLVTVRLDSLRQNVTATVPVEFLN